MAHDILDDNSLQTLAPPIVQRITWYFKHAVLVSTLHIISLIIALRFLPAPLQSAENRIKAIAISIMILGMLGISLYTYTKGFRWNFWKGLFAGLFAFFFLIIYSTNIQANCQSYYQEYFVIWFSMDSATEKELLDTVVGGFIYNILIIPCTEILVLIHFFLKKSWSLYKDYRKS